jgi:nitrate/nitrite transporter NarK
VVEEKLVKRGVSLKGLEYGKVEEATQNTVRQTVTIQVGISSDKAREINKLIKEKAEKGTSSQTQGDSIRVTAKKRDALQGVIAMLLLTAIPCFFITQATSYLPLLGLAFLVGFAGNLFSVGISWNAAWFPKDRQGFALGVFGAGNIGASVTKLLIVLLPTIIAGTAGATYLGIFPGGWRIFPAFYTVALVVVAALTLAVVPRHDRRAGAGKPVREMLAPLRHVRVWRFSLYYAAVFGAYVALAAWLPKYYVDNFDIPLAEAALLSATFIFPASLLRPVGGWFSDRWGARRVMYWTFAVMAVTTEVVVPRPRLSVFGLMRRPKWHDTSAISMPNTTPLPRPIM